MRIISSYTGGMPGKRGVSKRRAPIMSGHSGKRRAPIMSGNGGGKRGKVESFGLPTIGNIAGNLLSADNGAVTVEETFFSAEDVAQIVADQLSQVSGGDTNTEVIEEGGVLSIITTDESGEEIAKTDIENTPDEVRSVDVEVESSARSRRRGRK